MPTATPAMVALAVPSGAGFGEIVFSRDISADNQPLEAGTVFAAGSEPVYIFFEYRGLSNGVLWTQAWYREGEEMWRDTGPWQWGSRGRAWFFYTPPSGYTPGNYEVRLYIGDELQQTGTFIVQ
jgi:hypothetical protein